ncbi:HYR domain-containing protein [Christiangramia sabulilitoris]|uniref:HYR domain-containing protein n=1 Tax=Christiangramia sabulilitoris TaxID=2583991 RepID=A0A550I7P2_9FLAO|nr:HYR domain-containing protein [Christiangramia sabulilitoris]TRO66994.1 HYR domain-containing protein [Christiangramia sabulilitoris]
MLGQNPFNTVPAYDHLSATSLPTVSVNFFTFNVNTEDLTIAIATGPDNFVYNLTFGNGIQKRSADGTLIDANFITGLSSPLDLAIDSNGYFYVADYSENNGCSENGKIKIFRPDGSLDRIIFTSFYRPLSIDIDSDNNIYVAEYNAPGSGCESDELSRVSIYNSSGARIAQNRNVDRPYRIAVNSNKTVYLSQEGGNDPAVIILDSNLNITGRLPNILSPGSVVVDSFDFVHVIEYDGRIDFSRFINFENLSFGEIQDIAEEIDNGVDANAFSVKVFDSNAGFEYTYKEEIDFPVDLTFNSCDRMYINNAEVFGRDRFLLGYTPEKIEFDLEIYERTPAFDITEPIIICPLDKTVQAESGNNFAIVQYDNPTASDICGVTVTRTSGLASGSQFPEGENTVEFTATDNFGNTATCTFKIIVEPLEEDTSPVFDNCPENITKNNDAGNCGAVVTFDTPTVTDDSGSITPTRTDSSGLNSGDVFPVGVTTISFAADDGVNDPVTCSFTVSVKDTEDPVISCPGEINESVAFGESGKVINYTLPATNDNCGDVAITQTAGLASGEVFPVGTTENTFLVDDGNGNTASCSFNVVITEEPEDTPPVFDNCPENITKNNDAGNCGAVVTFDTPTVTDDSGSITPTRTDSSGLNSGDVFPVGVTTISFEADDGVNDPVTCSFTVSVKDTEDPVISCPGEINESVAFGESGKVINYALPGTNDNCGDVAITQTAGLASGEMFPVGTTVNTFLVDDGNGNTASCSFNVVISEEPEDTPPEFDNFPGNVTKNNDAGNCGAVVTFETPTVTDDSGSITPTRTDSSGLNSGDVFPVGETTISFEADDGVNDPVECSFTIIVSDNESPVFTECPAQAFEIIIPEGSVGAVFELPAIAAQDNCEVNIIQTEGPVDGELLPPGITNFEFIASDNAGNFVTCTFEVIVVEENEETPPQANCVPVEISLDQNGEAVITAEMISDGNQDMDLEVDKNRFTCSELGENTVILTVTNPENGLSDSCSTTVTVIDNTAPVITNCANSNREIFLGEGETYALDDFRNEFTALDNCDLDLTITQEPAPGTLIGETTDVSIRVTDKSGNTKNCLFTIRVNTETGEELRINCPSDLNVFADEDCIYRVPDLKDFVTVSNPDAILSQSVEANSTIGGDSEFTVTVTAIYQEESVTCDIQLIPKDEIDPKIICPSDETISLAEGETYTIPDYTTTAEVSDNCGIVVLTQQPEPGTIIDDDRMVTLVATDESGNETSCQFPVNIIRGNELSVNCPADMLIDGDVNCSFILPDLRAEAEVINGTDAQITQSPAPGSLITDSSVEVFINAESGSATVSCSFQLRLRDNTPPELRLKDYSVNIGPTGEALISFQDIDNGSTDNCDPDVTYELSRSGFTCKQLGENLIQVRAEDSSGNISTGEVMITVTDELDFCEDPVLGSEYIFLYPNPNTGSFRIAAPADIKIERVEVFDHRGRFIAAKDYDAMTLEYAMELGILEEAVYVLKIISDKRTVTRRLIFKY